MDPRTHVDQSLGLFMSTVIASRLLRVHKRIRTTRTVRTSPDDDTTLTISTSATIFTPIATEERPPPTPQVSTDYGTPDLSQETLSEHFCDTDGPTSHAQDHECEMRPMDTLVIAGNN